MSNLVLAGKSGAVMTYQGQDNPWAEMGRDVEGGKFLNFNGNSGELTFGSEDEVVPDKSTVVADLVNMEHGWVCWKDSEPVDEVFVAITEGKPPLEHQLKDHGPFDDEDDGWREAVTIPMILESVGGDQDHELVGTRLLFKTSTGGAVRSCKKLSGAFGKVFREHPGELPVAEITTESYTPRDKKYGKKYAINFKIIDWLDDASIADLLGVLDDAGGEYLPEDEPAAGTPTTRAPDPEPEPEPETVEEPEVADEAVEEQAPPPPPRRARREEAAAPAEEAPPTRRSRTEAAEAPADAGGDDAAPEPRGRSEGRVNRRTRRFAS